MTGLKKLRIILVGPKAFPESIPTLHLCSTRKTNEDEQEH